VRNTYAKLAGALVSVALLASGCGMLGKNDGSGDGGASACDGKGVCQDCTQCAAQEFCQTALANCQGSSACVGLDECLALCSGAVQCEQDCYAANPNGHALHDALRLCLLCEACPSDCAGQTTCE